MDEQVEIFFDCIFGRALKNGYGEIELRIISQKSRISNQYFFNTIIEACTKAIQSSSEDVYFGVNPRVDKGGKKENVKYLTCFHADIDYGPNHNKTPKWAAKSEALTAIRAFSLKPTYIVQSGGGFHCYWVLKEPLSVAEYGIDALEGLNKQFANELGGDAGTQDISRILRVPNTFNHKLITPRKVEIVYNNSDKLYNYRDILTSYVPKISANQQNENVQVKAKNVEILKQTTELSAEKLCPSVNQQKEVKPKSIDKPKQQDFNLNTLCPSTRFRKLILEGNIDSYESRSEADMAVIDYLVNNGSSDEQIQYVFWRYAIGDKYRSHSNPEYYLHHSIETAKSTSHLKEDESNSELFNKGILTRLNQKVVFHPVPFQEHLADKYKICYDGSGFYRYNKKCYEYCAPQDLNQISQNELNEYHYAPKGSI